MSPETARKSVEHDFFDPAYPRYAIEGRATLYNRKGGGDGPLIIDNPILIHCRDAGITMVMGAHDGEQNNLSIGYFRDDALPTITLRPKDENSNVRLRALEGVPVYEPSTDGTSHGDFKFADGFKAGSYLINSDSLSTKMATIHVAKDGSYVIDEMPAVGKG